MGKIEYLNNDKGSIWVFTPDYESEMYDHIISVADEIEDNAGIIEDGQSYIIKDAQEGRYFKFRGEQLAPLLLNNDDEFQADFKNVWDDINGIVGKKAKLNLAVFNRIQKGQQVQVDKTELLTNSYTIILNVGETFTVQIESSNPKIKKDPLVIPIDTGSMLIFAINPVFFDNFKYRFVIVDEDPREFFTFVGAKVAPSGTKSRRAATPKKQLTPSKEQDKFADISPIDEFQDCPGGVGFCRKRSSSKGRSSKRQSIRAAPKSIKLNLSGKLGAPSYEVRKLDEQEMARVVAIRAQDILGREIEVTDELTGEITKQIESKPILLDSVGGETNPVIIAGMEFEAAKYNDEIREKLGYINVKRGGKYIPVSELI